MGLVILAVAAMGYGTLDPDEIGRRQVIVDQIVALFIFLVGYPEQMIFQVPMICIDLVQFVVYLVIVEVFQGMTCHVG